MTKITFFTLGLLSLASNFNVQAEDLTDAGKSQYTLLNPTPPQLMRDWYTDHAGVSPYTIDAGHYEADITAVSYGYHHRNPANGLLTVEAWSIGTTVIKAGLLNNLDAEVTIRPYERVRTSSIEHTFVPAPPPIIIVPGTIHFHDTRSGFGDMSSRIKWNLWGNDGGMTALSLSGLVDYPTASDNLGNRQFEGGPALEFAAHLPCGFEMRIDSNVQFFSDYSNARQASFENLISFSHQIIGRLEGYCVFNTETYTTPNVSWEGTVKVGANYRLAKNVELAAGILLGVNGNVYDYNPFFGIAARF